jgi:hypothetical protein
MIRANPQKAMNGRLTKPNTGSNHWTLHGMVALQTPVSASGTHSMT